MRSRRIRLRGRERTAQEAGAAAEAAVVVGIEAAEHVTRAAEDRAAGVMPAAHLRVDAAAQPLDREPRQQGRRQAQAGEAARRERRHRARAGEAGDGTRAVDRADRDKAAAEADRVDRAAERRTRWRC